MGLVLRAQGAGQAGWHLLCCLLPTWAAGSSLEGDGLHLGPQGTRQLSAQSHRLASQFLLLLTESALLIWVHWPELTPLVPMVLVL